DLGSGATTDINLPGTAPDTESLDAALAALHATVRQGSIAVLSGSLPPGLPAETYAELVALLSEQGARVVVDASGEALSAVMAAGIAAGLGEGLPLAALARRAAAFAADKMQRIGAQLPGREAVETIAAAIRTEDLA